MPRSQRPLLLCALVAALVLPTPAARAGFFAGETVDGPSADVVRLGGVDLARDGSGALVYVKRDGGAEHVFASRLLDGAWQPPERLDPGLAGPSGEPVVAVSNGGRAAVAFTNGGTLYTVVRPAGASAWPAPVALVGSAAAPSIDVSTNGHGYVVWTSGGDVRAARLERDGTAFAPLDAPLDIDPAREAGSGTGRPRVAVSADGSALVGWGEAGHVYVRRLYGMRLSAFPQDANADTLAGHLGGTADLPEVDMPDDSSFGWVVFRQAFDGGATTRVLARRLRGSAFDPPFDVGAGGFGGEGADSPALDITGAGDGAFASETSGSHAPAGAFLYNEAVGAAAPLETPSAAPAQPQVAVGEGTSTVFAWLRGDAPGAPLVVRARSFKQTEPVDPAVPLSDVALGGVDGAAGFDAAADRAGDTVVAFVQAGDAGRRISAATWDRPPANLIVTTSTRWRRATPLRWLPASDPWGPLSYQVIVDGAVVGTFAAPSFSPKGVVADGVHRWQVLAVDRRGQATASRTRLLRLDGTPPRLELSIRGRRRAGRALSFVARVSDGASGVADVRLRFADGSAPVVLRRAGRTLVRRVRHAFAAGRHTVRITAFDVAGNAAVVERRITIRG